jgi:hypothetical protein
LFDCGEVVVGDVTGDGAFHGDLVDVVPLGRFDGRRRRCGVRVGFDVVPGQRWQPALCGGVGLGGVRGPAQRRGVIPPAGHEVSRRYHEAVFDPCKTTPRASLLQRRRGE